MAHYDIYAKTHGIPFKLSNGYETVTVRLSIEYSWAAKTSEGERWFENRGDGVWFEYGDSTETRWEEDY